MATRRPVARAITTYNGKLRWAQGQGEQHRGTRWHLVIHDDSRGGSKTLCGRFIVQSDSIVTDDYRVGYLKPGDVTWAACDKCWAKAPADVLRAVEDMRS